MLVKKKPELAFFINENIRINPKDKTLKLGRRSRYVYLNETDFPKGFTDNRGRIRKRWVSMLSVWLLKTGLKMMKVVPIELILSFGIREIIRQSSEIRVSNTHSSQQSSKTSNKLAPTSVNR
jgi:hypothetical protein